MNIKKVKLRENSNSNREVLAYIALGSNLGNRRNNLLKAISFLNQIPGMWVTKKSSFYHTTPIGFLPQPDFLNAVIEVKTSLSAQSLLNCLMEVESILGRLRKRKWGPRIIDLDILLYGQAVINQDNLVIPHPRMVQRRFVLEPLSEIAPHLKHPVLNKTVKELLAQCKLFPASVG